MYPFTAQCAEFIPVENGQVVISGTDVGSTATINCNAGYILNVNISILTCDSIGYWRHPQINFFDCKGIAIYKTLNQFSSYQSFRAIAGAIL